MQLYNSRKKYLQKPKEVRLWESIDWRFMSEESDSDSGNLHKHSLPWRSEGTCMFPLISIIEPPVSIYILILFVNSQSNASNIGWYVIKVVQ